MKRILAIATLTSIFLAGMSGQTTTPVSGPVLIGQEETQGDVSVMIQSVDSGPVPLTLVLVRTSDDKVTGFSVSLSILTGKGDRASVQSSPRDPQRQYTAFWFPGVPLGYPLSVMVEEIKPSVKFEFKAAHVTNP